MNQIPPPATNDPNESSNNKTNMNLYEEILLDVIGFTKRIVTKMSATTTTTPSLTNNNNNNSNNDQQTNLDRYRIRPPIFSSNAADQRVFNAMDYVDFIEFLLKKEVFGNSIINDCQQQQQQQQQESCIGGKCILMVEEIKQKIRRHLAEAESQIFQVTVMVFCSSESKQPLESNGQNLALNSDPKQPRTAAKLNNISFQAGTATNEQTSCFQQYQLQPQQQQQHPQQLQQQHRKQLHSQQQRHHQQQQYQQQLQQHHPQQLHPQQQQQQYQQQQHPQQLQQQHQEQTPVPLILPQHLTYDHSKTEILIPQKLPAKMNNIPDGTQHQSKSSCSISCRRAAAAEPMSNSFENPIHPPSANGGPSSLPTVPPAQVSQQLSYHDQQSPVQTANVTSSTPSKRTSHQNDSPAPPTTHQHNKCVNVKNPALQLDDDHKREAEAPPMLTSPHHALIATTRDSTQRHGGVDGRIASNKLAQKPLNLKRQRPKSTERNRDQLQKMQEDAAKNNKSYKKKYQKSSSSTTTATAEEFTAVVAAVIQKNPSRAGFIPMQTSDVEKNPLPDTSKILSSLKSNIQTTTTAALKLSATDSTTTKTPSPIPETLISEISPQSHDRNNCGKSQQKESHQELFEENATIQPIKSNFQHQGGQGKAEKHFLQQIHRVKNPAGHNFSPPGYHQLPKGTISDTMLMAASPSFPQTDFVDDNRHQQQCFRAPTAPAMLLAEEVSQTSIPEKTVKGPAESPSSSPAGLMIADDAQDNSNNNNNSSSNIDNSNNDSPEIVEIFYSPGSSSSCSRTKTDHEAISSKSEQRFNNENSRLLMTAQSTTMDMTGGGHTLSGSLKPDLIRHQNINHLVELPPSNPMLSHQPPPSTAIHQQQAEIGTMSTSSIVTSIARRPPPAAASSTRSPYTKEVDIKPPPAPQSTLMLNSRFQLQSQHLLSAAQLQMEKRLPVGIQQAYETSPHPLPHHNSVLHHHTQQTPSNTYMIQPTMPPTPIININLEPQFKLPTLPTKTISKQNTRTLSSERITDDRRAEKSKEDGRITKGLYTMLNLPDAQFNDPTGGAGGGGRAEIGSDGEEHQNQQQTHHQML